MPTEQESALALNGPLQTQTPLKSRRTSKKVYEKTQAYLSARFQGDGVRYKAKLIGMDIVSNPQGDKMCLDSMMKLKGWEVASRNKGQHKQRIWLKVSTAGVKIIDEKTGLPEHEHALEHISFLKKDDCDPRAFAYVFGHEGTYRLFFIKMANAADPVMEDFRDVSEIVLHAAKKEVNGESTPTQNGTSLLLDEQVGNVHKVLDEVNMFNNILNSPPQDLEPKKSSSRDELSAVFSPPATTLPASPSTPQSPTSPLDLYHNGLPQQNPWVPQMPPHFSGQPLGATSFSPPSAAAWGQQGPYGAQAPTSLDFWGAAGVWGPQQAVPGWGQTGLNPQRGPWPQSLTMMTPPRTWTPMAVNTPPVGTFHPPGGERFPPLGSTMESPTPVLWQPNSVTASLGPDPYSALRLLETESNTET
ncbi:disabled homolog 2 isoform X2 [Amia ocellicauda]|uniref:disabled homolog 2 isoform X2 n=1 Tax=Amia ocellicauda TaxID=2972642 RepID=UPI0034645EB6